MRPGRGHGGAEAPDQGRDAASRVFEVLDRLIDPDDAGLSKADLGRLLKDRRLEKSPTWKAPQDPSKTVQGWFSGKSRKTPSDEWREALVAVARERLDEAAAIQLGSALPECWANDKAARRRLGREEADLRAARGRVTAAWELKLHGVIELQDGEVPTVASRMGDDEGDLPAGAGDRWRLQSSVTNGALPAYVPRSIDEELLNRMRDESKFPFAPVVLLVGKPKAGKTRTVVEALRQAGSGYRHLLFHELLKPIGRDTLGEYHSAIEKALAAGAESALKSVLFIDDLHTHLEGRQGSADGSTNARSVAPVRAFLEAISRLQIPVIATCHPWILELSHDTLGISHDDQDWFRRHAVFLPEGLDGAELRDAIDVLGASGIDPASLGDKQLLRRLGAFLGDIDVLRRGIADAQRKAQADHHDQEAAARVAVVSGLVDSILFHSKPLTPDGVLAYARNYANLGTGTERLLEAALEWATSRSRPSAHGNPIAPYDATTNTLQLLDALHGDLLAGHKSEVPLDQITSDMAYSAGYKADQEGQQEEARDWWWRAAMGGHRWAHQGLANLAVWENRFDDPDEPMGDHAAGWWRRWLDVEPREAVAMLGLGFCRMLEGRYDDPADPIGDHAAGWYRRALAVDPTNANIMFNFGMLRRKQRLVDDPDDPRGDHAAGWYRRALDADPCDAGPILEFAILRRNQGRLDDPSDPRGDHAAGWYRRALEIDARQEDALAGLELLSRGETRLDDADSETLDAAFPHLRELDANPSDTSAMNDIGCIRREEGRLDDPSDPKGDHAAGWFRRALEADPADAVAMYNLGTIRADQGRLDDPSDPSGDHTAGWFRRALDTNPNYALVMYNFGIARWHEGRLDDPSDPRGDHAAGWFRRVLGANPNYALAMFNLGLLRGEEGRIDDTGDPRGDHALGWFRRAADLGHFDAIRALSEAGLEVDDAEEPNGPTPPG